MDASEFTRQVTVDLPVEGRGIGERGNYGTYGWGSGDGCGWGGSCGTGFGDGFGSGDDTDRGAGCGAGVGGDCAGKGAVL